MIFRRNGVRKNNAASYSAVGNVLQKDGINRKPSSLWEKKEFRLEVKILTRKKEFKACFNQKQRKIKFLLRDVCWKCDNVLYVLNVQCQHNEPIYA